jgi:hypothetical protein
MSHRGVEIVVGRLVLDEAMRRRFARAPSETLGALVASGLELNPVELVALETLDARLLERVAGALDRRLIKIELGGEKAEGR